MSEQRQAFRFRLPWLTAPAAPPPSQASQSPPQPAAQVQRRPFRPAGSAPAQPPPTEQPATKAEPVPLSSSKRSGAPSQASSGSAPQRQNDPTAPTPRGPFASPSRAVAKTKGKSQHNSPVRVAQQGQSPATAETLPLSSSTRSGAESGASSRSAPQTKSPGASPSLAISQSQANSQPNSPARVAQLQRVKKSPPKSPSPSRGEAETDVSVAPATKPPTVPDSAAIELDQEAKPLSTQQNQATIAEIAEPQQQETNQGTSQASSQYSQLEDITTPQTEKVMESPKGSNELSAFDKTKLTHSQVSVPKPESKQESRKEIYEASSKEPKEILKGMNHEEPEKKAFTQKVAQDSKDEMNAHRAPVHNELCQHPRKEFFDRKGILKTSQGNEHDTISEHCGHQKESRFNHKDERTGEKAHLGKEIKDDWPKVIHKQGNRRDKHELHEKPFSIITLTGENTGAIMELSSEPANRERSIHIHRGYKANPDESVGTVIDSEGSSRGRRSNSTNFEEEQGEKFCVNNNTQGINNSLVFNSSVTERNPGAHVVLSHKATEFIKPGKEGEVHQTRKAEVSKTQAENLTYASNIRRRCFRGLFQKSSDSGPENSENPRCHGCRTGCTQPSKDNLIDIL